MNGLFSSLLDNVVAVFDFGVIHDNHYVFFGVGHLNLGAGHVENLYQH